MGFTRKHLIYGALTFVSLLGAILKLTYFQAPGRGPLGFYAFLMYLSFLVWVAGQLRAIHEEEREESAPLPAGGDDFFHSAEIRPDDEALTAAEMYVSLGENMETICRFVEPRYEEWTPSERRAYRQGLRAALDERGKNG
jgi:hypothetical protein